MTWTDGIDRSTGYIVSAVNWNDLLGASGSLMTLKSHAHGGTTGHGSTSIGPLVREDFTDATAPAAPGAGQTSIYTVSGKPHFRANAGADTAFIDAATTAGGDLLGTYPSPTVRKVTVGSDADGDMYYRSASTLARLPKGAALVGLRMNSAATAPEWASAVGTAMLAKDVATTTICTSSTVEADLFRSTIAGNTIAATGGLHALVSGDGVQNEVGQNPLFTFRLKFGATTLASATFNCTQAATRFHWSLEVFMLQSATNAQRWLATFVATNNTGLGLDTGPTNMFKDSVGYATSAEDSTASKDFAVTGQVNFSGVTIDLRQQIAFIELYT